MIDFDGMTVAEKASIAALSQKSFVNFTGIWFQLIQGEQLKINWHHHYMADSIERIIRGEVRQSLVVNVPPGSTKTEFYSIHLNAYITMLCLTNRLKKYKALNLSYSKDLVDTNSNRIKDIIYSDEFQELWQCEPANRNKIDDWQVRPPNQKIIGELASYSTSGSVTGRRGGYAYDGTGYNGHIMLDDPDKPIDMFSETKRAAMQGKLTGTIRSRRGDRSKDHATPFIVIQQRLHQEDTSGFFLSGKMGVDCDHLVIPAVINEEYIDKLPEKYRRKCWKTIKDSDCREINGVNHWSFWPEMEHIDNLLRLREVDPYTFHAQYQQAPKSMSGNLVKADWFPRYIHLPRLTARYMFIDTNSGKTGDFNDYTVLMLVGQCEKGHLYIISVRRGKWGSLELMERVVQAWNDWKPYNHRFPMPLIDMRIEDKQAGQGLITDLKEAKGALPVKPVPRNADKLVRHNSVNPHIRMGRVYIPETHESDTGGALPNIQYITGETASDRSWVLDYMQEIEDIDLELLTDKRTKIRTAMGVVKRYDDQYDVTMMAVEELLIGGGSSNYLNKLKGVYG